MNYIYRPAQHGVQDWKARISIRSYHDASCSVSGNTRPPHLTEEEISSLTKSPIDSNPFGKVSVSLTPRLCYACYTLLTSRSSRGTFSPGKTSNNIPLPLWIHPTIGLANPGGIFDSQDEADEGTRPVKLNRNDMESQIAEFLLPDA